MRGGSFALGAIVAVALAVPASASATVRAGAAAVDATWHVGASAGQYASDGTFGVDPAEGTYNPTTESVRRAPSYGVQSRLEVRAIVVEGADGTRFAIAKTDQYVPQDLLYRRAAQLLETEGDCGITAQTLTMTATHDHSSPMYSSTSWGVWAFQDVFDVRMYDYLSHRIFAAVEKACDRLVPVRVGAAVGQFDKTHRHSYGPAIGDDGTPAGYPFENTDHDLSVVRFDDVSDPANPKAVATIVNFSGHPEMLEGNDLISADYIGPAQRMIDRATGGVTIWTQGAVGTAEPERSSYHSMHERLEFAHRDYQQAEYAGHLLSDAVVGIWDGIGADDPPDRDRYIPFMTDFPVQMTDHWYPGPLSHPYPTAGNCRSDSGLAGDPLIPIVGLPDCEGLQSGLHDLSDELGLPQAPLPDTPAIDPGLSTDDFESAGIPVPENYGAPGYTGLEEDIDVHLQGIRLGELYMPICSCEQWYDQSTNIETRTDRIAGDEYLGYDWGAQCDPNTDGTWTCPNPQDASQSLQISDLKYQRMRAQVNNPANGWNDIANVTTAESEPTDPAEIKGNYTHDDDATSAALGYDLTIPISMANDYNGYIATYREYQRGDHYRKALTGWGPHASDYLATRLVYIGRQLHDPSVTLPPDMVTEQFFAPKTEADQQVNDARAQALGNAGAALVDAYTSALPDDAPAAVVDQPADVERFGAAFFTWNGGSNFTDNPVVRVQRRTDDGWVDYADQSGELPVTLQFPQGSDVQSYLTGEQQWHWTAHFEAFVSQFETGSGGLATPAGTYRFVVDGTHRSGGTPVPYHLDSSEFQVRPWSGITVDDLRREDDGTVSFALGPRSTYTVGGPQSDVAVEGSGQPIEAEIGPIDYPDSYDSPIRFIRDERTAFRDPVAPDDASSLEWYCFDCSFRPWRDAGDAESAMVTIRDAATGAVLDTVTAHRDGDRWRIDRSLEPGEVALVPAGAVVDPWGDFNGAASVAIDSNGEVVPVPTGAPEPVAFPPDDGGPVGGPPPGPCANAIAGTAKGETLRGTAGEDAIRARGGDDVVRGRGGNDCLRGGRGRDLVFGGPGDDDIRARRGAPDVIHCGPGTDRVTLGRGDVAHGCERVVRK
jgi:hypothetical protein